jgi:hypothetical protein
MMVTMPSSLQALTSGSMTEAGTLSFAPPPLAAGCVAALGAHPASIAITSNSENIENNNLLVFILFSFVVYIVSANRSLSRF